MTSHFLRAGHSKQSSCTYPFHGGTNSGMLIHKGKWLPITELNSYSSFSDILVFVCLCLCLCRGMCAISASEGKSELFCTEFSEEFGDAPNSVTNSVLIFSPNSVTIAQVPKKHIFQWLLHHWIRWWFNGWQFHHWIRWWKFVFFSFVILCHWIQCICLHQSWWKWFWLRF